MSYAGEYSEHTEQRRIKDSRDKYRDEAHLLTRERDQAVDEIRRLRKAIEDFFGELNFGLPGSAYALTKESAAVVHLRDALRK